MTAERQAPAPDATGSADDPEQTPLLRDSGSDNISAGANGSARPRAVSDAGSNVPKLTLGPVRGVVVAISMWMLIFIQATNISGMTIIQGTVAAELEAYDAAMWFTTAYLIAMSSLAPLAGRLATIFAPRTLVLPMSAFVAAGGFVTSRASSFGVLILGRVLTGTGGAGVLVLALILVLELTGKNNRGIFVGLVNAGVTMGVSLGAVVFGALLPVIGWRPLFWIQIPISIVAGVGVFFGIPARIEAQHDKDSKSVGQKLLRIDYLGASLMVLTIVLFLYGLAGEITPWALLASLGALLLFVATEFLLAADPIIPLKVLCSRGALLSCLAQLGLMSARWTVLFYAPIFMLAVRGAKPAAAGSVLIPTNVGFGLGGLLVGWLHVRRAGSFWAPCVVVMALFSVSLFVLSVLGTRDVSVIAFTAMLLANGLVAGAAMNYTLAHMLHLSHHDTQYITTSLLNTFRGFGGSFGTAIGGGILYRLLRAELTRGYLALDGGDTLSPARQKLVARLLGSPELVFNGGLGDEAREVAIDGYSSAIRGVWQAMAVLGIAVVVVQALTGWKSPAKDGEGQDENYEGDFEEDDERAIVAENEGVAEA